MLDRIQTSLEHCIQLIDAAWPDVPACPQNAGNSSSPAHCTLHLHQMDCCAGLAAVKEHWLHAGGIAHMLVLQAPGLLLTMGVNGMLMVSKLPWPTMPSTEPEWPGCSLVTDSHMQVCATDGLPCSHLRADERLSSQLADMFID